jgi:hypothetical protein
MCRDPSPTLPWEVSLAPELPRPAFVARRVPSIRSFRNRDGLPAWRLKPRVPAHLADGPVMIATSLKSALPRRLAEGVRESQGIAFTAVSPFY